jgi:hypothetical protein
VTWKARCGDTSETLALLMMHKVPVRGRQGVAGVPCLPRHVPAPSEWAEVEGLKSGVVS